jgi:Reverse transcriptase (RNA-dependent DNA polymerase)
MGGGDVGLSKANGILLDLLDVCVVFYLDDILIYSENPVKHERHVREVLQRLHKNNLYTKIEKCEFNVNTTNFLGFVISPDGLQMDDVAAQDGGW